MKKLTTSELSRFSKCPVRCPKVQFRVNSLADYVSVFSSVITSDEVFWFRGHSDVRYSLTPSALRYDTEPKRSQALALMSEFKRIAEIKLSRPPQPSENLMWSQIAQHYGLPTRLLDWTESATTALFFTCKNTSADGMVFVLNPVALNRISFSTKPRVLDPQADKAEIEKYFKLGPKKSTTGKMAIAINPVWNSERLVQQKGVFTLHGSRFNLDRSVPSLVAVPILKESKPQLRSDLQRIGVDEMTLFPELEHSCVHLKFKAGL